MEYRQLGKTGMNVSVLGFGSSPLGNMFGVIDPAEGRRAVHRAVGEGINFFDVSPYYGLGLAEERLGDALRGRRSKVFLATKCGRYGEYSFDFSERRIISSLEESLRRLKTDHVDLLQAHDIEFGDASQIVNETIPAMRKLQQQGKVRAVGITGYPVNFLRRIAEAAPVDTILSYCHYSLLSSDLDRSLASFAEQHSIGLINASPLHMGILTNHRAPAWHPGPREMREAGERAAHYCADRGIDISSVALRFSLDYPRVATTVIGMANTQDVESNLRVIGAANDPVLVSALSQLLEPVHDTVWLSGRPENQN